MDTKVPLIGALTILIFLGACSSSKNERELIEESLRGEFTHQDMKNLADFYGNKLPSERWRDKLSGIE